MNHIKTLKIKATTGTETISGSKLFSYIDSDFKNFEMDKKAKPTKAIKVDVMEIDKNGMFKDYFTDPEEQAMTQGQILEFIKEHKDYLRQDGYATFFLFKNGSDFFVARVDLRDGGRLLVYVGPFSRDDVWDGEYRHRLVVPQLTLSESSSESIKPSETLTLESRILALKKQDLSLEPGFTVTAEYRLGEIRGYNQAIDEITKLLVEQR